MSDDRGQELRKRARDVGVWLGTTGAPFPVIGTQEQIVTDIENLLDALTFLRARSNTLEAALREFVEACWNHDGPLPDAIEAAAETGMVVLGDVISLAPKAGS